LRANTPTCDQLLDPQLHGKVCSAYSHVDYRWVFSLQSTSWKIQIEENIG